MIPVIKMEELWPEQIYITIHGEMVKLDHRVPGDGTDWVVATFYNGTWLYDETRIHPSDLLERVDYENE